MAAEQAYRQIRLQDSVICSLYTCNLTLIKQRRGTTARQAIIKRQLCQRQSLGLLHIHWAVKQDKQQHITNTNQIYLNYTGSLA